MSEKVLADTQGSPVVPHVDPTANVLRDIEGANKRQDDLRAAEARYYDAQIKSIDAIAVLRDAHIKELAMVRESHARELRKADTENFHTALGEIRSAAKELVTITTNTAVTLQSRVDATAATLGKAGSEQVGAVLTRVAALELAAAQGIGKQAVADPQLERLAAAVDALSKVGDRREGKTAGISASWVFLLGAVSLVSTLLTIGAVLYAVLKH